jgi:predicted ATP-dependent serine protease
MKLIKFKNIKTVSENTIKTGNENIDDFLSNDKGFVIGSSYFLTGTSGAGKTTFAILIQKMLKYNITAFYSREMSSCSVKSQTERLGVEHNNAFIADKDSCKTIDVFIKEIDKVKPSLVIVDSLQVILKEDYPNISEETACFEMIQKLRNWTEKNNSVLIVVGHVNKDNGFEGKNTIQHMFDAHMEMVYDKKKNTRILSWAKNRKGDAGKILYYEFGKNTMEFFTKNQYLAKTKNLKFEDFIAEAIYSFIDSLDKNHVNYKNFKKEFFSEIKELTKTNKNSFEFSISSLYLVRKLIKKYYIK